MAKFFIASLLKDLVDEILVTKRNFENFSDISQDEIVFRKDSTSFSDKSLRDERNLERKEAKVVLFLSQKEKNSSVTEENKFEREEVVDDHSVPELDDKVPEFADFNTTEKTGEKNKLDEIFVKNKENYVSEYVEKISKHHDVNSSYNELYEISVIKKDDIIPEFVSKVPKKDTLKCQYNDLDEFSLKNKEKMEDRKSEQINGNDEDNDSIITIDTFSELDENDTVPDMMKFSCENDNLELFYNISEIKDISSKYIYVSSKDHQVPNTRQDKQLNQFIDNVIERALETKEEVNYCSAAGGDGNNRLIPIPKFLNKAPRLGLSKKRKIL